MNASNYYVPIFNVYYKIYLILGIIFQTFLVYMIRKKSPPSMRNLKHFLYNTSFIQIVLLLSSFNLQQRNLPGKQTLTILANGPCRIIGPTFCFISYHIHMGIINEVGLSISNTVLFRFLILIQNSMPLSQIHLMIFASYISPLFVTIIPFTTPWDFDFVRNETRMEHPTYDLTIYEPFSGFSNVRNVQFIANNCILGLGVYGTPFLCLFLIWKVLSKIREHRNMSENTKKQSKTFIYGLLVQTMMPCLAYIPIFSCYLYTQSTGDEILISEHLILALSCLPGLIDPLISFYFIIPYRLTIVHLFLRKKQHNRKVFTLTSSNA